MGKLIDGKWQQSSVLTSEKKGSFERLPRSFRNWIGKDTEFPAQSGRYQLYVSYACPWAHRTLIFRQLKGLQSHIAISVVHPDMLEHGWSFDSGFAGATGDTLYGLKYLYQIYQRADAHIDTSVTVPVLWDTVNQTIVNNESSEIIRMFNSAFNDITGNHKDYSPPHLRSQIDEINEWIYHDVNNGVYKAGFARTQIAYEQAVHKLFDALDRIETLLDRHDYLLGEQLTEADIRLVTTLLRFDLVYFGHFKCNVRSIASYPNLSAYLQRLYSLPAVAQTTNPAHIKRHYYYSHETINPFRIVPVGPSGYLP